MAHKHLYLTLIVLSLYTASTAHGQTNNVVMLNANKYSAYFYNSGGVLDSKYLRATTDEDFDKFSVLDGDVTDIDTPLEIALFSCYSQPVVSIRPPEAAAMLPANSRTSDIKLAAATYAELQVVRFLDAQNRDRIGRYEAMLKFITDRNKITQSEINSALRAGIVDEEFNKISFKLDNAITNSVRSHDAVLTRNPQNRQYRLSYGGTYTNNETREIPESTLNALLAEMGSRKTDFDQTGINQVRAQAALIPAVAKPTELSRVKQALGNFYTTPNNGTSEELKKLYSGYSLMNTQEKIAKDSFYRVTLSLSPELAEWL